MGRNRTEKNVIYVGEGESYERDFGNGKKLSLKKCVVTPVSDEFFDILKNVRHVYEVKGQVYDVQGKSFKDKILKE